MILARYRTSSSACCCSMVPISRIFTCFRAYTFPSTLLLTFQTIVKDPSPILPIKIKSFKDITENNSRKNSLYRPSLTHYNTNGMETSSSDEIENLLSKAQRTPLGLAGISKNSSSGRNTPEKESALRAVYKPSQQKTPSTRKNTSTPQHKKPRQPKRRAPSVLYSPVPKSRKGDLVQLHKQHLRQWASSPFLQATRLCAREGRKLNLHSFNYQPTFLPTKLKVHYIPSTYQAPHEKRRDSLRLSTRYQLLHSLS